MYYHGSRNGDIKELTLDKSNDGYVWLIENYAFAVVYGGCSVRFWAANKQNNKPIVREVCEDSLEKMYKGVKCYVYCVDDEDVGEYEQYDYKGRKSIRLKHNVKVKNRIVIEDAYEEIMRLYKAGELEIRFWENRDETERMKDQKNVIDLLCKDMRMNYEKYPEDYAVLVKLFPETKLKELE